MAYYMKTIIKEPYEKEKTETFINEDELIRAQVGGEYKQEPLPGVEDVDVIRLLNNDSERGENLRNPDTGEIWRGTVIFVGANAGGEPEPLTDEQREDVFEFIRNNRADLDEEEYEVDETLADEFDINEDYDNTLKDMAEFNKKRDKGQGYFVKYDAGNVPLNNARFNNSVDVNADGGVGNVMSGGLGESVKENPKKFTKESVLKLAKEIGKKLAKDDLTMDVLIYVDGKRYKIDEQGNLVYDIDAEPKDYFNWTRKPNILSMSFEGGLYSEINENNIDYLRPLFEKYGLYYELGNAWNLSAFPLNEKDWLDFDVEYYKDKNIELDERLIGKKVCSECNKPIEEGYVIDDGEEYYCSEECLHKRYTPEEYERMERNSQTAFNDEGYDYGVKEGHWETFKNELEEAYDDIRYIERDENGNRIETETDKLKQLADNTEEIDTIKKDIIDVYDPVSAMILHSTMTDEWFAFFSKDGDRIIEKREDIMKLLDAETNDTEYQETFDDIMKSGIRLGQTSDGSLYHVDDFGEEDELKNGLPERGTFIVVTDSGDILRVDNIVEFYQSRF